AVRREGNAVDVAAGVGQAQQPFAGRGVPDVGGGVIPARGEPLAVGREGERDDVTAVAQARGAQAGDRAGRQRVAEGVEGRRVRVFGLGGGWRLAGGRNCRGERERDGQPGRTEEGRHDRSPRRRVSLTARDARHLPKLLGGDGG